ncbi:MAG: methyltransferase domain-containing protein [Nitrospinota bacterium]
MTISTKFDFSNTDNKVHKTYDELLLPRIFLPLAEILLKHADIKSGNHVLDVACGPGTVSRLAALETGAKGRVLGLDISSSMLEVAKGKPPVAESAEIEFEESPASPLNIPDNTFDISLCQQGLQFFPDRVQALKEMVRVTRPGGKIIIAVWGPLESCTIFHKLYQAMSESIPEEIADLLHAPFSLHNKEEIKNLAYCTGIENHQIETVTLPLVFEQGIKQAIRVLEATPFYPQIRELDPTVQEKLSFALNGKLEPLLQEGKVHGQMVSRIISIMN